MFFIILTQTVPFSEICINPIYILSKNNIINFFNGNLMWTKPKYSSFWVPLMFPRYFIIKEYEEYTYIFFTYKYWAFIV